MKIPERFGMAIRNLANEQLERRLSAKAPAQISLDARDDTIVVPPPDALPHSRPLIRRCAPPSPRRGEGSSRSCRVFPDICALYPSLVEIGQLLVALIAIFAAAKLFGELAERLGQPAVLGELIGGIVVGVSGLRLIDPHQETIHLLSQLGVVLLLFLIGLQTDLHKLIAVGGSATIVAVVGVTLPFIGGFLVGRLLGYPTMVSIFLGAALTATSVGITARVLSDLGHLKDTESQIILGAAVIDDVIGLIILTVVSSLAAGESLTILGISRVTMTAFGFVILAVVIGSLLAPTLIRIIGRVRVRKALFFSAVMFAFALAWAAEALGSALIVGAFAAGLVLARTEKGQEIEREVYDIAQFFIPIFFVVVGAAVDLASISPFNPATRPFFLFGLLLTGVGIVGKVLAGFSAFGKVRRIVIGVGMIPRGEVGLIFAQIGLSSGLLNAGLYSSVAMMVIVTTFMTPPVLRVLLSRQTPDPHDGLDLVMEAPED